MELKKTLQDIILATEQVEKQSQLVADRCLDAVWELRAGIDIPALFNTRELHVKILDLLKANEVNLNEIIDMFTELGGD